LESDARLQSALAASARAEASLNGLFRSIQHLGNGVGGAREANESLTHELEALRDMLGAANEQHVAFEQKIALLEHALERTRKDGDQDRAFLIEQQDKFLALLVDDQERELRRRDNDLETLRGRLAELERREPSAPPSAATLPPTRPESSSPRAHSAPFSLPTLSDMERVEHAELARTAQKLAEDRERARDAMQRLQTQRDEAQSTVARVSKERDEALQQVHRLKSELGGPRISTRPPSADPRRDSAPPHIPSRPNTLLTLDGLDIAAGSGANPSQPSIPVPSASQPGLRANPSQPGLSGSSQRTVPAPSSATAAPEISSVLSPPRSNPFAALTPISSRSSPAPSRLSPPPSRVSPPPEELRRALTSPPASSPSSSSASSSRPALKQKPDPSTRPLVGYSMSSEVEPEHLGGARLSSKAPPGTEKR
jgi:hypothetical protein